MLTLTNRIDMRPGAVPLVIHLGQYDSDFSLVFELYSSAGNFTVESGTTAMIRGTKTDGHAYDADATIDVSAKTVTVAGSEQMTAAKGRNVYELVLTKSGKVLSTANFILDVERAAMDADTIASESVLKELNAIIDSAATSTQAAADAASAADRAEDAADSVSSASTQIATNTADIADLKADLTHIGLSESVKTALLSCFRHVAFLDHDADYYGVLEAALYEEQYPRITATFTPGTHVVYTDDALSTLTPYLVIKYFEDAEDSGTIVPSTDYTLSGTLTEGQSVIRVSYDDLSTTFTLTAVDFYNIWTWEWSASGGNLQKLQASVDPGQTDLTKYPSGVFIYAPYDARRHYCVTRGQAPYYVRDSTAVASSYYPIPIPRSANHVKITTLPDGQYIYLTFYEFNGTKYDPRLGRTTWTELQNGTFERALATGSGNQRYLIFNMKYDSAGESYPVEPTSMVIEFSEVTNNG